MEQQTQERRNNQESYDLPDWMKILKEALKEQLRRKNDKKSR